MTSPSHTPKPSGGRSSGSDEPGRESLPKPSAPLVQPSDEQATDKQASDKQASDKQSPALMREMLKAQRLAFAPLLFQAARALRDRGILSELSRENPDGLPAAEIARRCHLSSYGATVLLEAGLAAELVQIVDDAYALTRAGYLFDKDPMTRTNTDFVQHVCYRAAEYLDASIEAGKPVGLSQLGPFGTVYEGLSRLQPDAKQSWFAFDHYYSDVAFAEVLPLLFQGEVAKILDVGGNTGKFAMQALSLRPNLRLTIADLPAQLEVCRENLTLAGLVERADFAPLSLLDPELQFPQGHDIIWFSQVLCCFSESEIDHILRRAKDALPEGGRVFILETFWDQQKNRVGEVCLQATSLYFTCVANGNSRMYDSATLRRLVEGAGLLVVSQRHAIAWGHSLWECAPRP